MFVYLIYYYYVYEFSIIINNYILTSTYTYIIHTSHALIHRPLHPEVRGAIAEVMGHAGESLQMRKLINETVKLYNKYFEEFLIDNNENEDFSDENYDNNIKNNDNQKKQQQQQHATKHKKLKEMDYTKVSKLSLASFYHRLGTIFLTVCVLYDFITTTDCPIYIIICILL